MDKIVDALTTTYRSLLVLCAVLLLLLIAGSEDPYPNAHKLAELEKLQADHYHLIQNMELQSHDRYLKQFLDATSDPAARKFLVASRFGSSVLALESSEPFPQYRQLSQLQRQFMAPINEKYEEIPLDPVAILTNQLRLLYDLNLVTTTAYLPRYKLVPAELQNVLPQLLLLRSGDPAFDKGFFRISPPEPQNPPASIQPTFTGVQHSQCLVTLAPFNVEKQSDFASGLYVACDLEERLPLNLATTGVTSNILYRAFNNQDDSTPTWGAFSAIDAIRELRLLAAQDYARNSNETEIFGFKLRKSYLLQGGPILISILLVQMLAYLGTAKQLLKRARRKEAGLPTVEDAAQPWFQQFWHLQGVFMFVTIVLLPTFLCLALTGRQIDQQTSPPGNVYLSWGYGAVLPAVLALSFFFMNASTARNLPENLPLVWRGLPLRQDARRITYFETAHWEKPALKARRKAQPKGAVKQPPAA